jgi:beta-galactosidase
MERDILAIQPLDRRLLGVAYYPEHWAEQRWADDAKMLREAGITVARMMEFAWDKLEPSEGHYDFAWMDRALAVFQEAGISVVLCTPTPTPPPWLTKKHPDILLTDARANLPVSPGSRRHVSASSPSYLAYTDKIVTAIAERWGDHPNVIGWQIDNEFGCHNSTRDLSPASKAAWQAWLKEKYTSLNALNAAWGTQFWSATYSDWAEIPVPAFSVTQHNPGLLLDFYRFSSDAWVRYQRRQIDILRPHIGPDRFITHNLMIRFFELDYFKLAEDLDFVAYDNYPHGMSGPAETALNLDIMRGLKSGRPFWVIEQQPGPVNWTPFNPPVPPGQVRAWTHQAFGHGAESVFFFRERAVNIGQEQYHAGLLKHDGTPDRGYHEAKAVAEDLETYPSLSRPKAAVALVFDYEDLWTHDIDPHNRLFSYYNLVRDIYNDLWKAQIAVDIVKRDADLSGYVTTIVPSPVLIDESHVANWRTYVEQGGNLIVFFRAFVKEQGNTWTDRPMPAGGLSDLLGLTVDEFFSIPPVKSVGMRTEADATYDDWNDDRGSHVADIEAKRPGLGFGDSFGVPPKMRYGLWAEVLKPTSATPVMRYVDGYYKDGIAATVNKVGAGQAFYIGTYAEQVIPRSVWQATGLAGLEMSEKDRARNTVMEIIRLQDDQGQAVEMRINHTKNTVSLAKGIQA